ncbi:hypothetical protein BVU17_01060 [Haloarcula taiwanensis]|uniref:Uncharacterized protein n=1 Tax=Haloarcula taiwanensis TaxID=1932004 RepID=A0A2H4ZUP7_9EURY|nr:MULTISPECIES: rod-determining factor RdfA [Haloarcula]AUG46181.1 hypothetical protein BVU17_01060 [Haloarcula taiwanensis]RLM40313.1 hypothetical protein DVK01_07140 [Haloarcula sp. Atlit-120R]
MTDTDATSGSKRGPENKVSRLIDEYDLDGVGATLERRWTADGDAGASLRELATEFNHRLVEAALAAENEAPLDGEAANLYRLLTDDEASTGARTKARHRLRRSGLDVDALRSDFVSHRAVRSYLTSCRGVTPPSERADDGDALDRRKRSLDRLVGRLERVTEGTVQDLSNAGELTVDDADVYVDVQVHCPTCDAQYELHDLLSRGGCDCQ